MKDITLKDLKHRTVYKLSGHEMRYAVWNTNDQTFIGLVKKNGFRTLYTYYYDNNDGRINSSNVKAVKSTGIKIPKNIKLEESTMRCKKHNIPVVFATFMSVGDLGWIHDDIYGEQCGPVKNKYNKKLHKFLKQSLKNRSKVTV